jgi:hypothetical protein
MTGISDERRAARRDSRAGEPPELRADRNMNELLQELRVSQTGVQVLFGFLLSLSFTERFTSIDATQRWIYVVTLLLATATTALLVAPVAVHRMVFHRGVKPQLVTLSHRLASTGLVSLAMTLVGAVLLVLDLAIGRGPAIVIAAVAVLMFAVLWYVLPLPLRREKPAEDEPPAL